MYTDTGCAYRHYHTVNYNSNCNQRVLYIIMQSTTVLLTDIHQLPFMIVMPLILYKLKVRGSYSESGTCFMDSPDSLRRFIYLFAHSRLASFTLDSSHILLFSLHCDFIVIGRNKDNLECANTCLLLRLFVPLLNGYPL